ncbi:MAG TPA: type III secretion system chaperone [Ramlibacter sp.]|uniref:type III secretion system chaperone n=1 Tax=Ramlibacter sp. TaxID=1917967 RepID=UPI002B9D5F1B|nr:type III secretion system chaperone [Ramlibacter sp.]HVZ45063.1 type III secretion system chaperone [Ramlibacter sp.]
MDPDQLLQSLGLALGLPNLRFDGNGCARLAIDGAPALNFERDGNGAIHLYSVLGPLPMPDSREAVYTQLLQGNLFGASTAGATLAIDELHGEVVLCRTVVTEFTSAPAFSTLVETFVDAAENWQGKLSKSPASNASSASPLAAPPQRMDHFLRG